MHHREISRREMFAYTGALMASAVFPSVLDRLTGYAGSRLLAVYVNDVRLSESDYIVSRAGDNWTIEMLAPATETVTIAARLM